MLNLKNKFTLKGDHVLWYAIIGLMIASVLVVYSSTGRLAYSVKEGNTSFYLFKQFILIIVCFVVMLGLQSLHYKYLLTFAKIILGLSFLFLLWAKIAGVNLNDASRWIQLPFGLSFQPSELAKLAIVIYTARTIAFYQTETGCMDQALKNVILATGPLIFLIFLDNFSTSMLIGAVCLAMLFVGRLRIKMILLSLATIAGMVGIILILAFAMPQTENFGRMATIKGRVIEFFSDNQDHEGSSYQANQAKVAVAKGGFFGVGPGNSQQRNYLPHPYSDFIFAIIIEEYGLLGGGTILLLYLIILYRVGVIVRRCTRTFPAILVVGLGLVIVFQAFINMSVCVGVFPVTGQPLPLVSMGGTSLLFTSAAFGMILSVSNTFSEQQEDQQNVEEDVEDEESEEEERIDNMNV